MTVTSELYGAESHSASPLKTSLFLTIRCVTSAYYWAEKKLCPTQTYYIVQEEMEFLGGEKKKKKPTDSSSGDLF